MVIEHYIKEFNDFGSDNFINVRKDSISKFSYLGFPSKKDEEWKFSDITDLVNSKFKIVKGSGDVNKEKFEELTKGMNNIIVFVDGEHSKELSKFDNVELWNFNDPNLKEYLAEYFKKKENNFGLLNKAFFKGNLINIKDGVVNIIHISTKKGMICPRNIIVAESCKSSIFEIFIGEDEYFTNNVNDLVIMENSKIEHIVVMNDSKNAFNISQRRVSIGKNASYESFTFNLGGKFSRSEINVELIGSGASVILNGLYSLKDQQNDNYTFVNHRVSDTVSNQLYKGLLDGKSKAVFNGCIKVFREAQRISSNQLNKNILLSDDSCIHTQPQLEIDADDVKCNHGATIGSLDNDAIFYLESRGISKEEAVRMLTEAFANEIVDKISDECIKNKVKELLK